MNNILKYIRNLKKYIIIISAFIAIFLLGGLLIATCCVHDFLYFSEWAPIIIISYITILLFKVVL